MPTEQSDHRNTLYSPVPLETIETTVENSLLAETVIPTIVNAFDELQLGLLKHPGLVPHIIRERAGQTPRLCVDEYPGIVDDQYSYLLFLTGEIAQTYLNNNLPALDQMERELVHETLKEYATHQEFNLNYAPETVPVVTRNLPHDELLMAEPGPFQPPVRTHSSAPPMYSHDEHTR